MLSNINLSHYFFLIIIKFCSLNQNIILMIFSSVVTYQTVTLIIQNQRPQLHLLASFSVPLLI